jgi:hypothetical protein
MGRCDHWNFLCASKLGTIRCAFEEDSDEYGFELSIPKKWGAVAN